MGNNIISLTSKLQERTTSLRNEYIIKMFIPSFKDYVSYKVKFIFISVACKNSKDAIYYDNNMDLVIEAFVIDSLMLLNSDLDLLGLITKEEFIYKIDVVLNELIISKMDDLEVSVKNIFDKFERGL